MCFARVLGCGVVAMVTSLITATEIAALLFATFTAQAIYHLHQAIYCLLQVINLLHQAIYCLHQVIYHLVPNDVSFALSNVSFASIE